MLLDWIEQCLPTLCSRVVVLTGGAVDPEGQRVLESGTFRSLLKPFPSQELIRLLSEGAPPIPDPSQPAVTLR